MQKITEMNKMYDPKPRICLVFPALQNLNKNEILYINIVICNDNGVDTIATFQIPSLYCSITGTTHQSVVLAI